MTLRKNANAPLLALALVVQAALLAGCGSGDGGPGAPVVAEPVGEPGPVLGAPPPSPVPSGNSVKVELVNDSGNPGGDDKLFVLFDIPAPAVPGAVEGIAFLGNSNVNIGKGVALSSLASTRKVVSPQTGTARSLYSFSVRNVDSGRLTFSYGEPVEIKAGTGPTSDSKIRFDKMELSFGPDPKHPENPSRGGGNLTAIDFHAIPLLVEVTHAGATEPDPLQTKTFHASLPTLLKTLSDLGRQKGIDMGPAFRGTDGARFAYLPGGTDFSSFARIMSPNALAASTAGKGSPAPYPSFARYLQSLVGKSFQVNGSQYGGYRYVATFASDGAGGYRIDCVGTVTAPPATTPPLPGPAQHAAVTVHLPADQLDFFIYATVANSASYSIAGYPFVAGPNYSAQDTVVAANASPYGALVGDLQAALNFGYLGGRFDSGTFATPVIQDINVWYRPVMLPYAYPFGGARAINDGFYNPYAAVIYQLSDAYGHPYSDRIPAASPLYSLVAGDTVRITILNDNRLDTPLVSVAPRPGDKSIDISWPTVAGASGYRVAVRPAPAAQALPCAPVTSGSLQQCTIAGLDPGTAYLVSVTATAANPAGVAIVSGTLPVQGITAGARPAPVDGPLNFNVAVNLPDAPVIPGMQAFVNGQPASGFVNGDKAKGTYAAAVRGHAGLNTLGLQVKDGAGQVVYSGNYFVTLSQAGGASSATFDIDKMTLDYGLTALTGFGPSRSTSKFPVGGGLVIGTSFLPKPYAQVFPIAFP